MLTFLTFIQNVLMDTGNAKTTLNAFPISTYATEGIIVMTIQMRLKDASSKGELGLRKRLSD